MIIHALGWLWLLFLEEKNKRLGDLVNMELLLLFTKARFGMVLGLKKPLQNVQNSFLNYKLCLNVEKTSAPQLNQV